MNVRGVFTVVAFGLLLCVSSVHGGEADPRMMLHVVRLKPGETKTLEFALVNHDFRAGGKSGRDGILVAVLQKPGIDGKTKIEKWSRLLVFDEVPNLKLDWVKDRPAISFIASGKCVTPVTYDLRIRYQPFGALRGQLPIADVRVIIE
jgi:hypothetical protein